MINTDTVKSLTTVIWSKTHKSRFVRYILAELQTEDNMKKMLEYLNSNPNWTEDLATKHALHIAKIKGFEND